jgi:GNAT superfamily N-acetyltransferase
MKYRFTRAESDAELAAVQSLTHAIFAGELGQYETRPEARIVDKFHAKNTYWVAVYEERVIGMISLHDQPPFSAAEKLANPGELEKYGKLAEIRLLAVEPAHRNGAVMIGLMNAAYEYASDHDAIVISGVVEKAPLYRRLGFRDLGPAVRVGDSEFIPMLAPVNAAAEKRARWLSHRVRREA